MQKLILITLFLSFTLKCVAQDNSYRILPYPQVLFLTPTKYSEWIHKSRKQGVNDSLSTTIKFTNEYDGACRLKNYVSIYSNFTPDTNKVSYVYDTQNRLSAEIISKNINGKSVETYRSEYAYKGTSNLIDSIRGYDLKDFGDVLNEYIKYFYDGTKIVLTEFRQKTPPNNSFMLISAELTEYDSKNRPTKKTILKLNSMTNKFDTLSLIKIGYSNMEPGLINSYEQNYNNDFTKFYSKNVYEIKQEGIYAKEIITYMTYIQGSLTSKDTSLHRYTYDSDKRVIRDDLISLVKQDSVLYWYKYQYNSTGLIIYKNENDFDISQATIDAAGFLHQLKLELFNVPSNKWIIHTIDTYSPSCASTSINNVQSSNSIKLFPNPAYNTAHLELIDESDGDVSIFDMTGKRVLQQSYQNSKNIDLILTTLKSGFYIVEVKSNNFRYVKKLIINR